MNNEWPKEIILSMAPFMYTCTAKQTENSEGCIAYQCEGDRHTGCSFKASFDPRDMSAGVGQEVISSALQPIPLMSIKPIFAWYDCWIGLFYDRPKRRLYIFPVPMCGVVVQFGERKAGI